MIVPSLNSGDTQLESIFNASPNPCLSDTESLQNFPRLPSPTSTKTDETPLIDITPTPTNNIASQQYPRLE